MKINMGSADRIIRTIIAVVIGILYFTNVLTGTWGIILMVLALVFLVTSLLSFCPIYTIFGLKTTKEDKMKSGEIV